MHVDVITGFVRQLDLQDITLFGQDWGGLIGLRVVAEDESRFARIMISNTGLPSAGGLLGWLGYPLFRLAVWWAGTVEELGADDSEFSFIQWVAYSRTAEDFDMQGLFQTATTRQLSERELAGYAAPFAGEEHLAGARTFPYLVPSQLRENERVKRQVYAQWTKPFMTAFGDSDPVTAGGDALWQELVPGAEGQPHLTLEGASHCGKRTEVVHGCRLNRQQRRFRPMRGPGCWKSRSVRESFGFAKAGSLLLQHLSSACRSQGPK